MTIMLELEPEVERGLQEQAQASGVTVETFVNDLVSRQVRVPVPPPAAKRTLRLSARDLGDMGSLHRRDIYDNVG